LSIIPRFEMLAEHLQSLIFISPYLTQLIAEFVPICGSQKCVRKIVGGQCACVDRISTQHPYCENCSLSRCQTCSVKFCNICKQERISHNLRLINRIQERFIGTGVIIPFTRVMESCSDCNTTVCFKCASHLQPCCQCFNDACFSEICYGCKIECRQCSRPMCARCANRTQLKQLCQLM
jgi:hypothetical protein